MKTRDCFINFIVFTGSLLLPLQSYAADAKKTTQKEQAKAKQSQVPLVPYVPPKPVRPIPKIRTSQGGTRGCGGLPTITLLVPEHVGLTTQEQPQLYWHITAMSQKPVVVTLAHDEATEPLLEWQVSEPVKAGINSINLAKHDVHLESGKTYEWSLRMRCGQGESASGDLVVKSYIERVQVNGQIKAVDQHGDPIDLANAYASRGYLV